MVNSSLSTSHVLMLNELIELLGKVMTEPKSLNEHLVTESFKIIGFESTKGFKSYCILSSS